MTKEFVVNSARYRAGRIPAMQQFHISRRLAGLLEGLEDILGLIPAIKGGGAVDDAALLKLAGPLGKALAALPDEDAEYVINTCLNEAERRADSGTWHKVRNAGTLQYQLSLAEMMQVVFRVLEYNFANFFAVLRQVSPVPEMPPAASG